MLYNTTNASQYDSVVFTLNYMAISDRTTLPLFEHAKPPLDHICSAPKRHPLPLHPQPDQGSLTRITTAITCLHRRGGSSNSVFVLWYHRRPLGNLVKASHYLIGAHTTTRSTSMQFSMT
jgi:hypothetical protein